MRLLFFLFSIFALSGQVLAKEINYHFLLGTYTNNGDSKGIYTLRFNSSKHNIEQLSVVGGVSNPSFLCFSPDRKYLYSVNENGDGSGANAFAFDKTSGTLSFLNRQLTTSKGPCNILSSAKHVFTANYGGGSVSVFQRYSNGKLSPVRQLITFKGSSINKERQNEPHLHQLYFSPDKKYVLMNDLGTDFVYIYKYASFQNSKILIPHDSIKVKAGSGPRHAVFAANSNMLYLVHEIDGTVSALSWKNGHLKIIQQTTVDRTSGTVNRAADIHLSPDNRFLYVSNRGSANNITCFSINKKHKLTFVQQILTGGDGPRNFALTPDGKYLLVANQMSNSITVFERDPKQGFLTRVALQYSVPAPVCILFF